MSTSIVILLFLFLLVISDNCIFTNINIEPDHVLLNSTNKTKLICTKNKDDNHSFEVNLSPNISSEYIQISTNYLNDTAIEIIIQSFDYIGKFYLICSSKGEKDRGARSNITIGKPPGLLVRAEPCIVYYDAYIDCKIKAPRMIQAINNGLKYEFHFEERRLSSRPRIYQQNPALIKTDSINKTLTFRWFPRDPGRFPLGFQMNISGTITDFGTANHIMDMTPVFRISSNFTVHDVSSTALRIELNHGKFPSISLCHGNLTRDDQIQLSNQRENMRTFNEFNQTTIRVTGLHPNTWYRLCFHCRRPAPIRTISDIECYRYKTLKTTNIFLIIMIIVSLLFVVTVIVSISACNCDRIREKIARCRHSQRTDLGNDMEMDRSVPVLDQLIPHTTLQL